MATRKLQQARTVLAALGLPAAQQNEIAAYTLLALADLRKRTSWQQARRHSPRIHGIIQFLEEHYGKRYAENTRETIRRQVLHQLVQAKVADRNPDEPGLSTNSPRTHYALSEPALRVLTALGTASFETEARLFHEQQGSLFDVYRAQRESNLVPVTLPSGKKLVLSPDRHNALQVAVVSEFAPRFLPGAEVLYLGDTAKEHLHIETAALEALHIPVTKHDKLPDVLLHLPERKWLVLVEAVTSHGPVSPKRKLELEEALIECELTCIYVSTFPDFKEFKRHIAEIAWETEVWLAEIPDHLIHFNGEKFLGAYSVGSEEKKR